MPGRIHPKSLPRYTASPVEPRVYEAMRAALPDGWEGWHSLRFAYGPSRLLKEIDFVVLVPRRGLFLIEVKGGQWTREDGQWFHDGRRCGADGPLEQVLDAQSKLRHELAAQLGVDAVPNTQPVLLFPDVHSAQRPTGSDLEGRVLTGHDLPHLQLVLESLARTFFDHERPELPWPRVAQVLHRLWGETWTPALSAGKRVEIRERELVALDRDQLAVLQLFESNPRVFVHGGAGTGKTLLAREVARRWSTADAPALVLCWTRALGSALRADGLDAHGVREYALAMVRQAGLEPAVGGDSSAFRDDDWDLVVLQAETDALPMIRGVARPLVVDEAQDFRPSDWSFVRALAGESLWVFGDDAQRFWSDRSAPDDLDLFRVNLTEAYRCPRAIQAFVDAHGGRDDAPAEPSEALQVVATDEPLEAIGRQLGKWLAQGVDPGDVAVLTLAGRDSSALVRRDAIGSVHVVSADDAAADRHVVLDTFLRFKGLERPLVIVAELDRVRSGYDVRMRIAASRATVGLVVVASPSTIASDARLRARRDD